MAKRGDPRLSKAYKAFRLKILARDSYTCYYCGAENKDMTIDHVIPISEAPELVISYENAVTACKPCNSRKGSRSQGVFLASISTPYASPSYLSPQVSTIHLDSPFQSRPVREGLDNG